MVPPPASPSGSGGDDPAAVRRRYRLLVVGCAVSSYGSYLNLVALNLYVYATTGSALSMGLFMAVRLIAGVLGGQVAGAVLQRVATKPVMIVSNAVQAGGLLALVVAPDAGRETAVFVSAAVIGLGGSMFQVALRSAIPEIVGPDRRDWANSALVTARSLAMVAGFTSAGVVVSLFGYTTAFLVDALSFLLCVAAVAVLPMPGRVAAVTGPDHGPRRGRLGAMAVLFATPALALMMGLRAVDALGSSSHNTGLPVLSAAVNPAAPAVFISVFLTCWAVGNLGMQQVVQWRARRGRPSVGPIGFGVATIVMSVAFIAAFGGFALPVAAAIALVAGAADGLSEVSYTSQLQSLPLALRTRAFGLTVSLESLGFGVGMVAVGAALEVFDPLPVVAVAHGASVVVAVVFLVVVLGRRSTNLVEAGPAPRDVARSSR